MNTLFDILVDTTALSGGHIGDGDLILDSLGQVAIAWRHSYFGIPDPDYRNAIYSTNGQLLQETGIMVTGYYNLFPDLAAGPEGFLAFTCSGPWPGIGTGKILYCYSGRPEGIGPAVSLEMVPAGATVLPASGGALRFTLTLQNYEATTQRAQIWTATRLPDNSWLGPLLGPMGLALHGNSSISRLRVQVIPGHAQAGTYWYEGRIGSYPDSIWACDGLAFTKQGTGDSGSGSGDWSNIGESIEIANDEFITPSSSFIISATPNPFNPMTVLRYELRDASFVKLAVYNVSGRLVTILVDGWREAGAQEVTFDGSNLASGIYIYRLKASGSGTTPTTECGKMVLMK